MRIVIAAGALKHSLSASEAAQAIAQGLRRSGLDAELVLLPIADGGNGTLDAFLLSGGQEIVVSTTDPLGRPIKASFGLIGNTAVIEMALASGLELLKPEELDPLRASTYGTGKLMQAALDAGANRVIVGVGGSATVDGGAGCLRALGVRLLDADDHDVPPGGGSLHRIQRIDTSGLDARWREVEVIIASDVDNPTLGEQGAAAVFGPQKGARPGDVVTLENNLRDFFTRVAEVQSVDVREAAGGGAAGALSAGLMAFLGGRIESGIDLILDLRGFNQQVEGAALVITSEGRMDVQTVHGKGPMGVAVRARELGVPAIALVGGLQVEDTLLHEAGLWAALPIIDAPLLLEEALDQAERLVERAAQRLGYLLQLNVPKLEMSKLEPLPDPQSTENKTLMNNQIEQLIKNLHEADTSEQRQTLESLAQIGTEAVEPLIALLRENEDPTLRRGAAFALGQLSDLNITPALIAALEQDSDIEVRLYAARALVVQGDARAIEPLVAALEDNDPSLREEAARSLGELADLLDSPRAVEPLAQLLDDSDWGTRQSAAEMLLRLQMEHIEQAESLLLADLQNVDNEIQLGAAWSLVELGDDRALEPLVSLLSHPDSRLSANAARGLGRLGDQRAVIPLTAALSHAKEALREAVQAALDRLNRLA